MPTTKQNTGGETARTVNGAIEQARTPLLAVLGAGDLATQAVVEAVAKARTQLTERADAARSELPTDIKGLREKLDPSELAKLLEQYGDAAIKLYQYLAEHGEQTFSKLRTQPQLQKAAEQFDQVVGSAQQRAESAVGDARELADEVLGRVVRRTRSTGEKTARAAENLADQAAEQVHEAGEQAAHQVRSNSRKAANRTSTARKNVSTAKTTKS
jgi:heparin binding hemagglutinin HbhA